MSLEVNTGRNNNRNVTWLENDNSIEMPLSPSGSESNSSSENTSGTYSSDETSNDTNTNENTNIEGYIPPTPLSENEVINPYLLGSVQNIINNCNTSVVPFRDNKNNIVGTIAQELQNYDLDCPICFDPLDTSDVITMDCCKKQLHLKCINEWHLKNIDSTFRDTKDLCIMCRTKSELMSDIFNSISITVYEDEEDDDGLDTIYNRRRRRRRTKCSPHFQQILCSIGFTIFIVLFVYILSVASQQDNNHSNRTRHH